MEETADDVIPRQEPRTYIQKAQQLADGSRRTFKTATDLANYLNSVSQDKFTAVVTLENKVVVGPGGMHPDEVMARFYEHNLPAESVITVDKPLHAEAVHIADPPSPPKVPLEPDSRESVQTVLPSGPPPRFQAARTMTVGDSSSEPTPPLPGVPMKEE